MKTRLKNVIDIFKQRGKRAEFLARWYLRLHGYRILCQNYVTWCRAGAGEVDIIANRGKTLVFVEVKSRKNLEKAAFAIKPQQRQRLMRAALCFLQDNPSYGTYDVRFDAVLVCLPFRVKHIPDAWRP